MTQELRERENDIWECKIGEHTGPLPLGSDAPMRDAVRLGYFELTGKEPDFIFSGWGRQLSEQERAVVENRLPLDEPKVLIDKDELADLRARAAEADELARLRFTIAHLFSLCPSDNTKSDCPACTEAREIAGAVLEEQRAKEHAFARSMQEKETP